MKEFLILVGACLTLSGCSITSVQSATIWSDACVRWHCSNPGSSRFAALV